MACNPLGVQDRVGARAVGPSGSSATLPPRFGPDRLAPARHATRAIPRDPPFERELSRHLLESYGTAGLTELYPRFLEGTGAVDGLMRRAIWRALSAGCGNGLDVSPGVRFRHLETIRLGAGTFLGAGADLQGHCDGRCRIGRRVWIGPGAFLDARDLVIGDTAGIGIGARILSSGHVALPPDLPVIATDIRVAPVRIGIGRAGRHRGDGPSGCHRRRPSGRRCRGGRGRRCVATRGRGRCARPIPALAGSS